MVNSFTSYLNRYTTVSPEHEAAFVEVRKPRIVPKM
jgi:hypothetical protein